MVARLDAVASVCVVELRALRCAHDLAWLPNPRVRLGKAVCRESSPYLMRVLQAAPVLQLASLEAWPVSAGAVDVLASLSIPQLTGLRLSRCPALTSLVPFMARQPQLRICFSASATAWPACAV